MIFPYEWKLSDGYPANGIEHHKSTVFGTFICGGGSSMGYKLSGYSHLGGVEIDPQISDVYKTNHNPKYLYTADIRKFNKLDDLPKELYNLDLLDGSPPCSSFSMSGNREKNWGEKKVFREGQQNQTLDDLVFDYIETIDKLKPKIALLENVKGLIQGNAKSYAKKINEKFTKAGYRVQLFLLNSASMGVPQKRERVFFIGLRKDLAVPKLKLEFNEKAIPFCCIEEKINLTCLDNTASKYWSKVKPGENFKKVHPKGHFFADSKVNPLNPVNTLTSNPSNGPWHYSIKRLLSEIELKKCGTYPLDYNFKAVKPKYLIGMSVPPVMTAQIAHQIYLQWLKPLKAEIS